MKTRDLQWYDLFHARPTRRDFVRVGAGVAGLVSLGALPGCGGERGVRFRRSPFALGVGAGDPTPDGLVLWARLAADALEEVGAAGRPVEVRWEVAEDEAFDRIVRAGEATALPELGHSVHAEVAGLRAGRTYHYRLLAGGEASPVGRARTAPAVGEDVDRLRFAFVSCQNYEHGYYTAFRHLAGEDVDFVAHLGDYIYEKRFGDAFVREHEAGEVFTLDEYRARYTTYRLDRDLQAAHHAAAWIATTDDHEVDNNYAGGAPEDDQDPAAFLLRRAAAYQAYYEFLPLRRSSMPAGPDALLYRRLRFGRLLELDVLDTRQYRSDQPCGDRTKPSCPEHVRPDRTILGADQRAWLEAGLSASQTRWNALAQQVMVARLRGRTPEGEETWSMDKWDGYPAERRRLMDFLAETRPSGPVVLTGDVHSNWVADLKRDFDDPASSTVGTELVGTSITSGGDGRDGAEAAQRIRSENPHVRFYNGQRGYVVNEVTPERWTAEYRVVPVVTRPDGPVETRARFAIDPERPGAVEG